MKVQHDLLATYRDDFYKYGGEIDARLLQKILLSVAEQLGNKFVYSRVDPGIRIPVIKKALTLLSHAKVCSMVAHTSGNGLPLGAQSNEKFFKTLMVDVGLIAAQLGLSAAKPLKTEEIVFANRGGSPNSSSVNNCGPPRQSRRTHNFSTGKGRGDGWEKSTIFFSTAMPLCPSK